MDGRTNEELWYMILNDTYIANGVVEKDIDAEYQWFDMLPKEQQKIVKEKSWEKIFDMFSLQNNPANYSKCSYIQATFWELHLDNIVEVRYFKGRR